MIRPWLLIDCPMVYYTRDCMSTEVVMRNYGPEPLM